METKLLMIGFVLILTLAFSCIALAIEIGDDFIVAYYGFEEGEDDDVGDSSKNANDGKLEGNAEWAAGKFGNAILFDGEDDYVEVPTSELFGMEKVSVLYWMYPQAIGGTIPRGRGLQFCLSPIASEDSHLTGDMNGGLMATSNGPSGEISERMEEQTPL